MRFLKLLFPLIFVSTLLNGQSNLHENISHAVNIFDNEKSIGSGFYYYRDTSVYLVTAAHVLFKTDSLNRISSHLGFEEIMLKSYSGIDVEEDANVIEVVLTSRNVRRHKEKDVCVVKIASIVKVDSAEVENVYTSKLDQAATMIKNNGRITGFSIKNTRGFEELRYGEEIRVIGFPTYLDIHKNNTGASHFEFELPLLQGGVIAGISNKMQTIVINAPVFYGNSGGAVLCRVDDMKLEKGKLEFSRGYHLIGIVTSFIPFIMDTKIPADRIDISNSGYTNVVPIDFALELMN